MFVLQNTVHLRSITDQALSNDVLFSIDLLALESLTPDQQKLAKENDLVFDIIIQAGGKRMGSFLSDMRFTWEL